MLDVTTVGSELTPAQQSETLSDLAFFLDEFGSTRAVRGKLQEQERDIERLERQVQQRLATVGRDNDERAQKPQEDTKLVGNQDNEITEEDVDETMVDLDFFLRTYKSTRAVRELLVAQRQRIEDLHRTIQVLEQIRHKDDSCDAGCLGTAEKIGQVAEKHLETQRVDVVDETDRDADDVFYGGDGNAIGSRGGEAAEVGTIATSPRYNDNGSTGEQESSTVSSDDIHAKEVTVAVMGTRIGKVGLPEVDGCLQGNGDEAGPRPLYVVNNIARGGMVFGTCESKHKPINSFSNDTVLSMVDSKQLFSQGSSISIDAKVDALDRRAAFTTSHKSIFCQYPNCVKRSQMRGLCYAHGGYRECEVDGCSRKAATRHLCSRHGGRAKCANNECGNFAVSGSNGHCYKHAREHCVIVKKPKESSSEDGELFGVNHGIASSDHETQRFGRQGLRLDEPAKVSPLLASSFEQGNSSVSYQPRSPSQNSSTSRTIMRRGPHVTCKAFGCLKWVKRFGDLNDYCAAHRGADTGEAPPTSGTEALGSAARAKDCMCKEPGCSNKRIAGGPKKGFCFRHGGGYRCIHPGCSKARQRNQLCVSHGGISICNVGGCNERSACDGFCRRHFRELSELLPAASLL